MDTTKNLTRQIFDRIQWFSRTNASASNSVFEAVRQTLRITVCEKVCGQTTDPLLACSTSRSPLHYYVNADDTAIMLRYFSDLCKVNILLKLFRSIFGFSCRLVYFITWYQKPKDCRFKTEKSLFLESPRYAIKTKRWSKLKKDSIRSKKSFWSTLIFNNIDIRNTKINQQTLENALFQV